MKTKLLFLILFMPLLALAADGDAVSVPEPSLALGQMQLWITLATPFVATLATALVKYLSPKINPSWLPTINVFLGTMANTLATFTVGDGLSGKSVALGVLASLGGIGIREIKDRIKPESVPSSNPTQPKP